MIAIDYAGGAHGNFLETVLNGIHYGKEISAFNHLGASHLKKDIIDNDLEFRASHWTYRTDVSNFRALELFDKIINIYLDGSDLPRWQLNCWHRAGNGNIRFDDEKRHVEDILLRMNGQRNKKRDIVWKPIYDKLESCRVDGEIDKNSIRDMIKHHFIPQESLILKLQNRDRYNRNMEVLRFPFSAFYDWNEFITNIKIIIDGLGRNYEIPSFIKKQHDLFLSKNLFKDVHNLPQKYMDAIVAGNDVQIVGLKIYQEALLDLYYETYYNVHAFFAHTDGNYFKTTNEVRRYISSVGGKI